MRNNFFIIFLSVALIVGISSTANSAAILYSQNFENPAAFVNNGGDVNLRNSVNILYGNQPTGFTFAQTNTVETLLITGNQAFGSGYSDPSGIGGNYALGMLSSLQNDLIGLSFDVGAYNYLNFRLDISSIDLSVFNGPFVPSGAIPEFSFTLFDNPGGATGLGSGTILDTINVSGTASARSVFDWTRVVLPLDASGNTNGNVTLRIDLLSGGYAALDNFQVEASDIPAVPIPAAAWLLGSGLIGLVGVARRRKS